MIIICLAMYNYVFVSGSHGEKITFIVKITEKNQQIKSFTNKELKTILLADVNTSVNNFSHYCK